MLKITHYCCFCCSEDKLCLILWDHVNCSMSGSSVLHYLLKFSYSCPLGGWCYLTISSSVTPFSFSLQSFPASGSSLMSRFLASGGQSIGAQLQQQSFPMNIQNRFPLGLTDFISLQSNRLSRVFSSTTIWKHLFFSIQLSLWSNSHIPTWLLEKP